MHFDLIVIGGGAAGFFGAIQAAEKKPGLQVLILEKSSKLLSKVRISGGGRCNVTHHCYNPYELARHYPRGEKSLKNLLRSFHAEHMVKWLASKGVVLKSENDGRMFPITDSSETIIACFISQAERLKIKIHLNRKVVRIDDAINLLNIVCADGEGYTAKKILIATGGNAATQAYNFIADLQHTIRNPIPSLFTFNDSEKRFNDLMGVAVQAAQIKIAGTKFSQHGAVLITHWGLSGPAVIKLSAWAAEYLHEVRYEFTVLVSWIGEVKEEEIRTQIGDYRKSKGKQKVLSNSISSLPYRLWQRLCQLADVEEAKTWSELSQKKVNKLVELLIRCPFQIKGKTTFKEEFVTCGGVDLKEVDLETMESKLVRNIFFAGEVLNIDGETGGFNFQSAWTTAFIAAKAITSG